MVVSTADGREGDNATDPVRCPECGSRRGFWSSGDAQVYLDREHWFAVEASLRTHLIDDELA